jgi:hypothetical protein
MTHRYTLAAVLLAAMSIPAAAQQTTQPDTSKKAGVSTTQPDTSKAGVSATPDTSKKAGVSGVTTTTSPGAIAEPAKSTDSTSGVTASPGATVTSPAPTTPSSTMTPSPATPSAGASVTAPAPSGVTSAPSGAAASGATGQVQPTSGAAKVEVKVAESLANTVKISADSAFALARASNSAGQISSAELEMTDNRLVYQVKMVNGSGASTVYVDAMTGEVVKDKKFGGVKAAVENAEESQKLIDAKKDSSATKKP